jgi:hypothetical protein
VANQYRTQKTSGTSAALAAARRLVRHFFTSSVRARCTSSSVIGSAVTNVELPLVIERYQRPVFRNGRIYAVTRDDLDVPYVVSARTDMP